MKSFFTSDWRDWWRWWSVRIHMAGVFLTGWLWFEPSSLLAVWNMLPRPVQALLPNHFITAMGAILFVLSVAGIFARPLKQPKLEKRRGIQSPDSAVDG